MRLLLPLLLTVALVPTALGRELQVANRDSAGLVAAIERANTDPTIEAIHLAAGGLYTLSLPQTGRLGLPSVQGRLLIDGHGAEIRRYGRAPMTLIDVAPAADLVLRDLTLAEGNRGALRNRGRLRLEQVAVVDSNGDGLRGVVINHGLLEASDSLFGWNDVHDAGRDAATLINHGVLRLRRCRFEGNLLSRRYPTLAAAGAVLNHGRLWLDDVAFVDNEVIDPYGGLASASVVNLDSGEVSGTTDLLTEETVASPSR